MLLAERARKRKRSDTAIAAREHALKLARPILDLHEVRGWKDFVEPLRAIFCSELGPTKEVAYDFIAKVLPAVTGENAARGTIKRFVNRCIKANRDKH